MGEHRSTTGGAVAKINQGRWTAEIDGDFVVFLIGARPSKLHLLQSIKRSAAVAGA